MKKIIFIYILIFFPIFLFAQPPSLTGIPTNNSIGNNIPMYEKFEIDLKLNRQVVYSPTGTPPANTYQTPHDSDEISLYARFSNVSTGHSFKIHFFYNEPYQEQANPCIWPASKQPNAMFPNSSFSTSGNQGNYYLQSWKIRCAFREPGLWNYSIFGKDKFSKDSFTLLYSDSIDVTPNSGNKGFIKKLNGNNTYLFFDNGEMCFLNGVNEFFAENQSTFICRMRGLIDKMTDNKINFMRLWIEGNPGWYFTSDIQGEALGDVYCTSIFNQKNAKILDELFDYARSKNMYIQPCLYAPNLNDAGFNVGFTRHNAFYKKNDKHLSSRNSTPNVGEITNPWDFYNPDILKYMRNYIKYCVSRWGYATNITGWEIGNEINFNISALEVRDTLNANNTILYPQPTPPGGFEKQLYDWHKNFKKYLNYYDAHQHLVTTSLLQAENRTTPGNWKRHPLSNEQFKIFSLMDYTTSHNYFINPTCPEKSACLKIEEQEDANFNTNIVFREELSKPTQVQEWGSGDDQCTANIRLEYYISDPFGVSHHNVALSSAFSGSFGTALTFNTYFDLQPSDYYYHYKGIGEFINKFGILGNPLYVKKERTLVKNNNSNCSSTDFANEGLRYYYMANSDKMVLGWCQDKRFSFPRLYWNNPEYLKTFEKRHKPATENSPNDFMVKVPQKGFYKVKWCNTLDVNKFIQNETIVRSSSTSPINHIVQMSLPKSLHNEKLADGFFSIKYTCERVLNFEMEFGLFYHYGDKLSVKINEITAIDEVEIVVERVDQQGHFIDILFKKILSAKDFMDVDKRELNNLYNSTNPPFQNIPFVNNATTYYKLHINPTNPDLLSDCYNAYNTSPVYFQIMACNSLPKLKINGIDGSSLYDPIVVNHGDPINLDGEGSYGGTGYRRIVKEIDAQYNYSGTEYNIRYNGKFNHTISAHNIVREATLEKIKYLPSNGGNNYRLYEISHANFNSYPPSNGCTSWELTSEFVKINCGASVQMDIVSGGGGPIKEFAYGEPVYLDGRQSKGETGYRIIIQPIDANGNFKGKELNKLFNGSIDTLIEINSIVKELTKGAWKYLPPDLTGPAFYKVFLAVFNAYGDGGCEEWVIASSTIKVLSCHTDVHFTVNSNICGNSLTNPYFYTYANPIVMNGLKTKGETSYRIILKRYDLNGNILNEYKVLYQHMLKDTYDLNEWYALNINKAVKKLPAYNGSTQNIWSINLIATNTDNDQGCDEWNEKSLFFKLIVDLKCDFIINFANPQNHQIHITSLCKNEGTYLNTYNIPYGCDKYTIKMEELELATWKNPGTNYVTYERRINNNPTYLTRKETFETYESLETGGIDLEKFWCRRTGYQLEKSKVYKVSLTTFAGSASCTDNWTLDYKYCRYRTIPAFIPSKNSNEKVNISQTTYVLNADKQTNITMVSIFPNPTSSFINILIQKDLSDEAKVEISDLCAKNIYSKIHNDSSFGINLSQFNSGIYFLKVIINNNFYNFKVIKL